MMRRRHRSTAWFCRDREKFSPPNYRAGLGISRYALDERLSRSFRELGGALRERSRCERRKAATGCLVRGEKRRQKGRWIGLKCHVLGLDLNADLEMHLASNGYVGLAKWNETRSTFAVSSAWSPAFRVRAFERSSGICARGASTCSRREYSPRGSTRNPFLALRDFNSAGRRHTDGIAPLGDAWGMIPPFTGNGMSMAFESAELAAEPLQEWHKGREMWSETLERISRKLKRRFARRMFWGRAMHPFLTTNAGQALFTLVSRSAILPFQSCYHALR